MVWTSYGQDGSGNGVFGQRFNFGGDTIPPRVTVVAPDGGEKLFTGSSYLIRWTATDDTALASIDVSVSLDGGGSFTPIAECQGLPGGATSCLWRAPGPPSVTALVRVSAQDASGNVALDDSDGSFRIVAGVGHVTVVRPNTDVQWPIGSLQAIEWTHNLGRNARFRIELDRNDDGSYEEMIAAAAPATSATTGRFNWRIDGPPSGAARVRLSWTGNPALSDASDVPFQIGGVSIAEWQVNTYTTDSQFTIWQDRAVAADARGNFVIVWTSRDEDGSGYGVFAQRYDDRDRPLGSEFRVNSSTANHQWTPSVAAAAAGDFVVVWGGYTDGDSYGIFGQRYDSTGMTQGGEFQVNSYTTGEQRLPSVASDASGNFVVAWEGCYHDDGRLGHLRPALRRRGCGPGRRVPRELVHHEPPESAICRFQRERQLRRRLEQLWPGRLRLPSASDMTAPVLPKAGNSRSTRSRRGGSGAPRLRPSGPIGSSWPGLRTTGLRARCSPAALTSAKPENRARAPIPMGSSGVRCCLMREQPPARVGRFVMRTLRSWLGFLGTLALAPLPGPAVAQRAGPPFQVNTYTTSRQLQPSVASDGAGNLVVVWMSK